MTHHDGCRRGFSVTAIGKTAFFWSYQLQENETRSAGVPTAVFSCYENDNRRASRSNLFCEWMKHMTCHPLINVACLFLYELYLLRYFTLLRYKKKSLKYNFEFYISSSE